MENKKLHTKIHNIKLGLLFVPIIISILMIVFGEVLPPGSELGSTLFFGAFYAFPLIILLGVAVPAFLNFKGIKRELPKYNNKIRGISTFYMIAVVFQILYLILELFVPNNLWSLFAMFPWLTLAVMIAYVVDLVSTRMFD